MGASKGSERKVRYTVFARRGGMIGYFGLRDNLKGSRVVGVNLASRERMQGVADDWNAKEES